MLAAMGACLVLAGAAGAGAAAAGAGAGVLGATAPPAVSSTVTS